MAKSAGHWAIEEAFAVLKRRMAEAFGFALLLACLLLILTLFTYDPRDGSLNTAVDSMPHNFLRHDGAVWPTSRGRASGSHALNSDSPACLVVSPDVPPPLRSTWPRLALLPTVLTLGAVALSILDLGALSPPAGPGGALGWGLERLLVRSGLGAAALPISMAAAAIAGLLLLATMGLSLRDGVNR